MAELIVSSEHVSTPQCVDPAAEFLFGGYSWVKKQFELWSISFDTKDRKFIAQPARWLSQIEHSGDFGLRRSRDANGSRAISRIAFAGDQAVKARGLLTSRLASSERVEKLDMQPFEVVRDMLRDATHSETIGGAPQIVKVYQYMQTAPLGVYWPAKASGQVHLQGRPCLGYEKIDRWILDPDSLLSERPASSRNDADDAVPEVATNADV